MGILHMQRKRIMQIRQRWQRIFVNYIKTDDGKRRLNQGLYEAINMDSFQKQISTAMSSYMGQAMSAYTGAISQAISTQMTSAMSQVTTQLAGGLEAVMTSAMSRIGEICKKHWEAL